MKNIGVISHDKRFVTSFLSYDKCVVCRPRLTNIKKNVRSRISFITFCCLSYPFVKKKMLILTFVICHVLGRGTFAVVEKCKYKNNIVAVKKLHSNLPQNLTNIFTKEALLLRRTYVNMFTIYVALFLLYLKLLF